MTVSRVKLVSIYRTERQYVAPLGSLAVCRDATIIATFREAPRSRLHSHIHPEARAMMAISDDGGESWNEPVVIYDDEHSLSDPSICELVDGTLLCTFFLWKLGTERELPPEPPPGRLTRTGWDSVHTAWTVGACAIRSSDRGKTWTTPVQIGSPLGLATLTSDPAIQLSDGDILVPVYGLKKGQTDCAAVCRSTDGGMTWSEFSVMAQDPLKNISFMEPSLVQLRSGKIIAMHRTHHRFGHHELDPSRNPDAGGAEFLFQCDSTDGGRSWNNLSRTVMWGHPPHLLELSDGRILCVYGYRRPPYGVRGCVSRDGGRSWAIEDEIVFYNAGAGGDLGYPASVQRDDGVIVTAWYESSRAGISEIQAMLYRLD